MVRSNVKLVILPPNTNSKVQFCDAKIIHNVQIHYRKQVLHHVLNNTDDPKKVNIIGAIAWLKNVKDVMSPITIKKCFAKCEILDTSVNCSVIDDDDAEPQQH